jgi:hypothetical protein
MRAKSFFHPRLVPKFVVEPHPMRLKQHLNSRGKRTRTDLSFREFGETAELSRNGLKRFTGSVGNDIQP